MDKAEVSGLKRLDLLLSTRQARKCNSQPLLGSVIDCNINYSDSFYLLE